MTLIVALTSLIAFAISTTILGIDASEAAISAVLLTGLSFAFEMKNT